MATVNKIYTTIFLLWLGLAAQIMTYASNYKFESINDLQGISIRKVYSICKDNDGFIWASTKSGVLRLTQDEYRIYELPFQTVNFITVKLVFENNILWAYSNNGQLFRYDPIKDKFLFVFNLSESAKNQYINVGAMLVDNSEACWMATSFGLYKYFNGEFQLFEDKQNNISSLCWYDDDTFFAVSNEEIALIDTKTQSRKLLFQHPGKKEINTNSLYYDKTSEVLWLGSQSDGLLFYSIQSNEIKHFAPKDFPQQPVKVIEPIDEQTLLAGVDGQGIWEIDRKNLKIKHVYKEDNDNSASLRGNGVYDIFFDKENERVWVGTYSAGISYFDMAPPLIEQITHQPNQENSLKNNEVNEAIEDKNGNLWLATNNGISQWKRNENRWKHFYANNQDQAQVFLTIHEDNQGKIWAGSYASGLHIIDRETGKELAHYAKNIPGSPIDVKFVYDIFTDSKGEIWICGINSEVVRYSPTENKFTKYSQQPVSMITEYSDSIMLLACSYGLVQLNKNTSAYKILIDKHIVEDILPLNDNIWVATSGEGLLRYNMINNNLEKFTTKNGLPSNYINSLASSSNYLWLGTESGLCRFDPRQKSAVVFSSIEPLSSSSFNNHAYLHLRDGRLAFGSNNGLIIFNPQTISEKQNSGKIFIQDFSILGRSLRDISSFKLKQPINNIEHFKLKHNQNTLTFEILPVGTIKDAKFSWKIDDSNEWSTPSKQRHITFNNLPHKNYTLNIKMFDNSLSYVIDERTVHFTIAAPFWASWWFLIIVFSTIFILIYSLFWYYINKLKQQHAEEKIRYFTNTAHDIRTSLTLIKAPVDELKNETNLSARGKQFLKLASEQTNRLSNVITQLMDFQKADIGKEKLIMKMTDVVELVKYRTEMVEPLCKTKNIKLIFKTNTNHYETAIDDIQFEKVIDNLISNAIKYSRENSTVYISLECKNTEWNLVVKDEGIGISKADQKRLFKEFYRGENAVNSKVVGSGVGLLLSKNIVLLHGGNITFNSEENKGSEFLITIPHQKMSDIKAEQTSENERTNNKTTLENTYNDLVADEKEESKQKILLVEDNEELLQFLCLIFGDEYEIYIAFNGSEGWEQTQKHLPDLIVSDVMMPEMDGFEFCKLVKSTWETSHIPVILLTALNENTKQLQGLGLGADDYITKPFDASILKHKLHNLVQSRKAFYEKALQTMKEYPQKQLLGNPLNDKILKQMVDVVKENMANTQFGKVEFASALCVSPSLLYKKTKAIAGLSPVDFIKSVRLDHSIQLLQNKEYTIAEISELCGFSNQSYFSAVFKKKFGKTPSEYYDTTNDR